MSKDNLAECKYRIDGMHCDACEVLIKGGIDEYKNISSIELSRKNSYVVIKAPHKRDIPTVNDLNNDFRHLGYKFSAANINVPKEKVNSSDYYLAFSVFAVVAALFYVVERSGFLASFTVESSSSFFGFFLFGLAAGVSSCAALVGSIILALSKNWSHLQGINKHRPFIMFSLGRLGAFAVFGGILGALGALVAFSVDTMAIFSIVLSLLILVMGLKMLGVKSLDWVRLPRFKFAEKQLGAHQSYTSEVSPFLIGVLTFFVPCGFTLIAQTTALSTKDPLVSALMLLGFALGTAPMLILINFSSIKLYGNPKASKIFNLFAGFLTVFFAIYTMNAQLNVLGLFSLNDIKIPSLRGETQIAKQQSGVQIIQIEANAFDYSPKYVELKAGIPAKIEIFNEGAVGCANAFYARDLYPEIIYLKPGFNETPEFIPTKGTYKISCSMGMVAPVTVKVI